MKEEGDLKDPSKLSLKKWLEEGSGLFLSAILSAFLTGFLFFIYLQSNIQSITEIKTKEVALKMLEDEQNEFSKLKSEFATESDDAKKSSQTLIQEIKKNKNDAEAYRGKAFEAKINAERDLEDSKATLNSIRDLEKGLADAKRIVKTFQNAEEAFNRAINNQEFVNEIVNRVDTHPIGTILIYSGSFKSKEWNLLWSKGWRPCDGALYPNENYPDLYNILKEKFPERMINGKPHFKVPDLRGRTPVGAGTSNGNTQHKLGEKLGKEKHTIALSESPPHRHAIAGAFHPNGTENKMEMVDQSEHKKNYILLPDGNKYGVYFNIKGSYTSTIPEQQEAMSIMQPSLVVNFIIKAK